MKSQQSNEIIEQASQLNSVTESLKSQLADYEAQMTQIREANSNEVETYKSKIEEMRQKLDEIGSQVEHSQATIVELEGQLNSNNEIQSSLKVKVKLVIKLFQVNFINYRFL